MSRALIVRGSVGAILGLLHVALRNTSQPGAQDTRRDRHLR
jgi:hypothetical protein